MQQVLGRIRRNVAFKKALKTFLPESAFALIRSLARAGENLLHREKVAEHFYGCARLKVLLSDPIAVDWYDHDWAELPELRLLKQFRLKRGAKVFDIGAHHGVVALMIAHEVGGSGEIVAVECMPRNGETLRRNAELNGVSNIRLVAAAVNDSPGKISIQDGSNSRIGASFTPGQIEVEAITLDQIAERHGIPDVVFIDVEGAECKALAGATRVLASRPDLFVEVHVGTGLEALGGSVSELARMLPSDGYRYFVIGQDPEFKEFKAVPFEFFRSGHPVLQKHFSIVGVTQPE